MPRTLDIFFILFMRSCSEPMLYADLDSLGARWTLEFLKYGLGASRFFGKRLLALSVRSGNPGLLSPLPVVPSVQWFSPPASLTGVSRGCLLRGVRLVLRHGDACSGLFGYSPKRFPGRKCLLREVETRSKLS